MTGGITIRRHVSRGMCALLVIIVAAALIKSFMIDNGSGRVPLGEITELNQQWAKEIKKNAEGTCWEYVYRIPEGLGRKPCFQHGKFLGGVRGISGWAGDLCFRRYLQRAWEPPSLGGTSGGFFGKRAFSTDYGKQKICGPYYEKTNLSGREKCHILQKPFEWVFMP